MAHEGKPHRHCAQCITRASLTAMILAVLAGRVVLHECWRRTAPNPNISDAANPEQGSHERVEAAGQADIKRSDGLLSELSPFLFGAVPVLVPLLGMGLFADSAVAAAVLWQGGVSALFLAMVPLLLPLVAGGSILVLRHLLDGPGWWSGVAFAVTFLLLAVVPFSFAIIQAIVVVLAVVIPRVHRRLRRWLDQRPRQLKDGHQTWQERLTVGLQVFVALGSTSLLVLVCAGTLPRIRTAAIGRITAGIPEEMVLYNDSTVRQPARVRVLQVDEQFTTVLDGNPPHVVTIRNNLIRARVACQSPKMEWSQRSPIEVIFNTKASGTMVCRS